MSRKHRAPIVLLPVVVLLSVPLLYAIAHQGGQPIEPLNAPGVDAVSLSGLDFLTPRGPVTPVYAGIETMSASFTAPSGAGGVAATAGIASQPAAATAGHRYSTSGGYAPLDVPQALPIVEGDPWRYWRGVSAPAAQWNALVFDDSTWELGPSGFGYGDGDDQTLLDATNPPAMLNAYTSVYIRKSFDVPDLSTIGGIKLKVDYDDAFVAYVNGVEVARSASMGGTVGMPPAYDATAASGHEASRGDSSPQPAEEFLIDTSDLVQGTNVIALQGHNQTKASSDFSLIPTLVSVPPPNDPPSLPANLAPQDGATGVGLNAQLCADVSDPEGSPLEVTFHGREAGGPAGEDFTVVVIPDPQVYSQSYPDLLAAQTQWVVDNRVARNIVFVTNVGDTVNNGDEAGQEFQWVRADSAFSILENPVTTGLPDGIPYGNVVGNHDNGGSARSGSDEGATTIQYTKFFGLQRFCGGTCSNNPGQACRKDADCTSPGICNPGSTCRGYYGGRYDFPPNASSYPRNFDNHYELFTAGGMDFIIFHLELDGMGAGYSATCPVGGTCRAVLQWVHDVLQNQYPNRRAIVSSHSLMVPSGAAITEHGQALLDAVRDLPNVFLTLSGHLDQANRRTDLAGDGHPIYSLVQDYQSRPYGGRGWLRVMTFSPQNDTIHVRTLSPWVNYPTTPRQESYIEGHADDSAENEFTLPYDMDAGAPFLAVGSQPGVPSGSRVCVDWSGRRAGTTYEWYAAVSDGISTTTSAPLSFTTSSTCATSLECNDGNVCTTDVCNASNLCENQPIAGCCTSAAECDDLNPCTDDSCDGSTCAHADNTAACNDGNACTTADACSQGACVGGPAATCNDGNACTDDTCNPASGCLFTPNAGTCDDGNACTTSDSCGAGACAGTYDPAPGCCRSDADCNDAIPATDDACVGAPGGTCANTPRQSCDTGGDCNDGDGCTGDVCQGANVAALSFDGADDYVTMGAAPGLNASPAFTVEAWINGVGGVGTSTGSEGLASAIPLVTKGRAEQDTPANLNMNYFLGIAGGKLAGDFEDAASGLNHAVCATTNLPTTGWHHVAATYDPAIGWKLYLDGASLGVTNTNPACSSCTAGNCTTTPGASPEPNSSQHFALGTAMTSGGAAAGYYAGLMDEVRVWNRALTEAEIQAGMDREITSGTGLLGRWGLNEGSGTAANDSTNTSETGTLANGTAWTTSKPALGPGLCSHTAIAGCVSCGTPAECNDGVACTSDACVDRACVSSDACTGGKTCNPGTGLCEAGPATVTFQEGIGGYAGTQDTELTEATPDAMNGALETWRWDTDDPGSSAKKVYGLIRFDNIFGAAAGQIPPGSAITSATLTVQVYNASAAPAGNLYESAVAWNEGDATWNNFGGEPGVQADEYGRFVAAAPIPIGSAVLDVTSSLQAWTTNPAGNLGWVFVPASTDGAYARSSEYAAASAERPKLTVTFVPAAAGCTGDIDCDDGLYCNGSETCEIATGLCLPGTPVACTDGIACTADACNETTHLCDHVAADTLCDDGNVCTDDTCDVVAGCLHGNNTAPCDDGNACTTSDACSMGACAGGAAAICNDGNVCTTDTCVPATGCLFTPNTGTCDDGNACTTGDTCGGGACAGGYAPVPGCCRSDADCDDGVTATTDTCTGAPGGNCSNVATQTCDTGAQCDDGNACTADECVGGNDSALNFDGTNYVTMGPAAGETALGARSFTLEAWIKRDGATWGTTASTGSGGVTAVPLVTKGLHEQDGDNRDCNYFLGIAASGTLAADFEQFAASPDGQLAGQNRPGCGTQTIPVDGTWHHVAVTYDTTAGWKFYVDGVEGTAADGRACSACTSASVCPQNPGVEPRYDSIQHFALGTAMNSGGTPEGYFAGMMDEVRVWNRALSEAEIVAGKDQAIESGTGLIGRWGLDEKGGNAANDSTTPAQNGTLVNAPAWSTTPDGMAPLAPGTCTHTPIGGCTPCTTPSECDDGNACTTDSCVAGVCQHGTATCDDGDACTSDTCDTAAGCQHAAVICNDGNACTTDTCNPASGCAYPYAPVPGCCQSNADCNDGVAGTTDTCLGAPNGNCSNASVRYCSTGTECDDGNACTTDECLGGDDSALNFDGTNDYVTMGAAAGETALGARNFTLETWIKRDGADWGVTTGTGNGGVTAVPIIAKGRGEAENSNVDCNYFLGIGSTSGRLMADFEQLTQGAGGWNAGQNHPACSTGSITDQTWHHVAVTYSTTSGWHFYIDGVEGTSPDGTSCTTCAPAGSCPQNPGVEPRYDSIQHFGLGTAMNSGGTADGYFAGKMDEVRVWNRALSAADILAGMNVEIESGTGLIGRWALDENGGTTANDSATPAQNGTLTNGPVWSSDKAPLNTCAHTPIAGCTPCTTPDQCNDGNACTTDACVAGACQHASVTCDDGNACNGVETCDPAGGCVAGTALSCDDGNVCNGTESCNPASGCVAGTPLSCSDGNACNGLETCDPVSGCQAGTPPDCNDSNLCTTDACNPATGLCEHAAVACDDGVVCNGVETCDPASGCQSGPPAPSGTACDDGNVCTTGETCDGTGACGSGAPVSCDDGNPCTMEACTGAAPQNALNFDGIDDYVDLGTGSSINDFGTGSFTVEGWFFARSAGQYKGFFRHGRQNSYPQVVIQMPGSSPFDQITASVEAYTSPYSATQVDVPAVPLSLNTWHHVAVVVDRTPGAQRLFLYLDGSLASSADGSIWGTNPIKVDPATAAVDHVVIGAARLGTGALSYFFDGRIDEVRIWSGARKLEQIQANKNLRITSAPGLLARWGLDEGTGTTSADSSGNGNNGVLGPTIPSNVPTWVTGAPALAGTECAGTPLPDGTSCADGNACNGAETCQSTACTQGTPLDCNDSNLCTLDACDPATGCRHTAMNCDDGNVCTTDTCNPASGCLYQNNTAPCDDGNACTAGDTCAAGGCAGVYAPLPGCCQSNTDCNDANPGTDDACVGGPGGNCTNTPKQSCNHDAECDDANACTTDACVGGNPAALSFGVSNGYVTMTQAPGLGAAAFTLEGWIKKDPTAGWGTANASTGSGGLANVVALITKGRSQADGDNRDCNYFLGITTGGRLVADFEQYAAGPGSWAAGLNHPICSTAASAITDLNWHHVAVTYDKTAGLGWRLYLDGVEVTAANGLPATCGSESTCGTGGLDPAACVQNPGVDPRYDSIQHFGLGVALDSTGVPTATPGYFRGLMDEVRVWNRALTPAEVSSGRFHEIATGTGLIGRWALDGTANDSTTPPENGTLVNGPTWSTTGAPLDSGLCSHTPIAGCAPCTTPDQCNDGNACTTDACVAGVCQHGTVTCDDGNACNGAETCNPASGCVAGVPPTAGSPCEDGDPCTTGETCDGINACVGAAPVICDDGNSCTTGVCSGTTVQNALAFDGTNDYVDFGAASTHTELGLRRFTIECWFKKTGAGVEAAFASAAPGNAVPLVTKGRGVGDGDTRDLNYFLGIAGGNRLVFSFEQIENPAGADNIVQGAVNVNDGAWHHAAVTYDGVTLRLFTDGAADGTLATTTTPRWDSMHRFAIGTGYSDLSGNSGPSGYFAGQIDEVRVWDRALDALEISGNMNRRIPRSPHLVGRWGLDELSGTTAADSSGNANNGTLTNGPAWVAGTPSLTLAQCVFDPVPDGTACADNDLCNGAETCQAGSCAAGTPLACGDGNACNGVETCNPSSGCVAGVPVTCTALDQCHDVGVCEPATGACTNPAKADGSVCNDGNICTMGDTCTAGVCAGAPLPVAVEVQGVMFPDDQSVSMTWTDQGPGVAYDVVGALLSSRGMTEAACLADDLPAVGYADLRADPPLDDGYFYLIRAQNACSTGTFGFSSDHVERQPIGACP